jgi:hypothetical protein
MERVWRKLTGVDDGNRQMVDILNAVLTDGFPADQRLGRRRVHRPATHVVLVDGTDPGKTHLAITIARSCRIGSPDGTTTLACGILSSLLAS